MHWFHITYKKYFTLFKSKTVYTRISQKMWWSKPIVLVKTKMIVFLTFNHKLHIWSTPWKKYPYYKRFIMSLSIPSLTRNKMNNTKSNSISLLKNVYMSLNVQISFLKGRIIWTQLSIYSNETKKIINNHNKREISIINIAEIIVQNIPNRSSYIYYFKIFYVHRK